MLQRINSSRVTPPMVPGYGCMSCGDKFILLPEFEAISREVNYPGLHVEQFKWHSKLAFFIKRYIFEGCSL